MPKDMEEQEPAFKVVDRRRFTEEGQERAGIEEKEEASSPKDKSFESPMAEKAKEAVRPAMNFSLFVQSLAHQTMMALGLVPWPDSGLIKKELTLAKETIDILQMLKEKTINNLTKEEESLLNNLLYQLQVAFVEISKQPSHLNNTIIK